MFSNQSRSLIILCLSSAYKDPGGQQLFPPGTTESCERGHSGLSHSLERLFIATLPSPKGPEPTVHRAGGHTGVREGSDISEDVFPALGWVPAGICSLSPSHHHPPVYSWGHWACRRWARPWSVLGWEGARRSSAGAALALPARAGRSAPSSALQPGPLDTLAVASPPCLTG